MKLTTTQKAYAGLAGGLAIAACIKPVEVLTYVGKPAAIAAACVFSKKVYNLYKHYYPTKSTEPQLSSEDQAKKSLEQRLIDQEKQLTTQVKEMDTDLIDAIKKSKNPAALLVDYATVTELESKWLKKFSEEAVNDTALLKKMTDGYTKIMKEISPEEEMRKFGVKSMDMLLLAMECEKLRVEINPDRANSQKFKQELSNSSEVILTPVIKTAAAAGNKVAQTQLQQSTVVDGVIMGK